MNAYDQLRNARRALRIESDPRRRKVLKAAIYALTNDVLGGVLA